MAWFRKRQDLISDRARLLNNQIAELEGQIKKLDARLQRRQHQPRLPPGPQLFFGRFELSARYRVPHRLADRPVASSPSIKGVF